MKICKACDKFSTFLVNGKEKCVCNCEKFNLTNYPDLNSIYHPSYDKTDWEKFSVPKECIYYAEYFLMNCNDDEETEERH